MKNKSYVKAFTILVLIAFITAAGFFTALPMNHAHAQTSPPAVYLAPDSSIAAEWMDLVCRLFESEGLTPPHTSRICAYAGIALYEAALPAMPGYRTLTGQLNEMPDMPRPVAGWDYDWSISITSAMDKTLRGFFTSDNASKAITDLYNAQVYNNGDSLPLSTIENSIALGESIGTAILEWADGDGFKETRGLSYTPPAGPGMWVPTPPGNKPALEPFWGDLRTFALYSADSCVPPQPFEYSTENTSAFYQQALCVYEITAELTDEQKTIAEFWADDAGKSFTPPGHWLSIENQMVEQLNLPIDKAVEMYALTGIAMADAFISCWHCKFQYNVVRPITYINEFIDPAWEPVVVTPPFPEYTSGHSVASGAASAILDALLGKVTFEDKSYADKGVTARTFNSFGQAAQEAAISRLYGGIHYPITIQNGVIQGQMLGKAVLDRLQTSTR